MPVDAGIGGVGDEAGFDWSRECPVWLGNIRGFLPE
jgi:hypothetical protein